MGIKGMKYSKPLDDVMKERRANREAHDYCKMHHIEDNDTKHKVIAAMRKRVMEEQEQKA